MKKFKNILFTVVASIIIVCLLFSVIIGFWDPFTYESDPNFLPLLKGIGNLFLLIVAFVFCAVTFSLFGYVPAVIYLCLRKNEGDEKAIKDIGIVYAIVFGGTSILAIAGCLLRELH